MVLSEKVASFPEKEIPGGLCWPCFLNQGFPHDQGFKFDKTQQIVHKFF